MNLVAEPALRADAETVADDQPDHQLRVDRGASSRAVEGREQPAEVRQIDEPVDPPQQMVRRYVVLDRELVEQRTLRHLPPTHHRRTPPHLQRK